MDLVSYLRDALGGIMGQNATGNKIISPIPQDQMLNQNPKPKQLPPLKQTIDKGLQSYSPNQPVPVATLSGDLAQAGNTLQSQHPNVDPLLPVILAIMESGGGRNLTSPNNLYNIGPGVSYPSPDVSILGGGQDNQRGLLGVLTGGLYNDYLNSGNLADFFNRFTPQGNGNPTLAELLARYQQIRSNFAQ